MKQGIYRIAENKALTDSVWFMALEGDTSACTATGQFINLKLDGLYLRRPISVYDWTENQIQIIYKVVGKGTEQMSRLPVGATLDVLTGLGNGYRTEVSGERPVLIGGGVGIPPLYALCKQLLKEGKQPSVILGFNTKQEVFCKEAFETLLEGTNGRVYVTLVDGGDEPGYYPGFVTDVLSKLDYTYFYTCGPSPMFRAIEGCAKTSGQFSFEERMGCGFGACMGCTCKTKYGNKRICKDGPVLEREEIIW